MRGCRFCRTTASSTSAASAGAPSATCFVHLLASDYERVRADNDRFVVVPGHEDAHIERVVERNEGYFVVDKRPEAEPFVGADGEPDSGGIACFRPNLLTS